MLVVLEEQVLSRTSRNVSQNVSAGLVYKESFNSLYDQEMKIQEVPVPVAGSRTTLPQLR